MARPVLVGMNNPLSSDPKYALYPHPVNCTGWRIWKMMYESSLGTVSKSDYIGAFERRNILSQKTWSAREAGVAGRALMDELSGRTIVFFGVQTLRAVGLPRPSWGEWRSYCWLPDALTIYTLMPHPSGRCHEYNDPAMRERLGLMLRNLMVLGRPSPAEPAQAILSL